MTRLSLLCFIGIGITCVSDCYSLSVPILFVRRLIQKPVIRNNTPKARSKTTDSTILPAAPVLGIPSACGAYVVPPDAGSASDRCATGVWVGLPCPAGGSPGTLIVVMGTCVGVDELLAEPVGTPVGTPVGPLVGTPVGTPVGILVGAVVGGSGGKLVGVSIGGSGVIVAVSVGVSVGLGGCCVGVAGITVDVIPGGLVGTLVFVALAGSVGVSVGTRGTSVLVGVTVAVAVAGKVVFVAVPGTVV